MSGGWSATTELGYELSTVSSSLQKTIRRGAERDAIFWAIEMAGSVYNGYLFRRMITIAVEDCGLADPHVLGVVLNARARWKLARVGAPGGRELVNADFTTIAEAVVAACRAAKNREADDLAYLMSCRFGETDKKSGVRVGKDPRSGEQVPPLSIPLPPGSDEMQVFARNLREKHEFENAFWAYVLCEQKREVAVWDKLAETGTLVKSFLENARAAREVFWREKKEPDRNLLCFALLLVCRQEHMSQAKPTVPDSYRDDARELLKEILSRRSGIDPASGKPAPRWLAPIYEEYLDGHTDHGRRKLRAEAKKNGKPFLLLWNSEFYEHVARLNRLVEIPGEKNWMKEMCEAAGCDWEKYRSIAPAFAPHKPAPECVKIEDCGDWRYRIQSFTEANVMYSVDILARQCNCPFASKNPRKQCKHVLAILRMISEESKIGGLSDGR